MKLKIVTTVSSIENPLLKNLEHSLKLFGYDYKIIQNSEIVWNNWGGWPYLIQWLKSPEASEYTHVIYTDGFDTLALCPPEETEAKLLKLLEPNPEGFIYSVEKHWFPHEEGWEAYFNKYNEKVKDLPPNLRWRYVNGGQFAGSKEAIINWYESAPRDRNNQAWGNYYFACENTGKLILDLNCELFQTISHSGALHGSPEEFTDLPISNVSSVTPDPLRRIKNNLTGSFPCFVHANGVKNPIEYEWMYKLLGL